MNHIAANRQALKEKQRMNKATEVERQSKELERQKRLERKKQKLYGNIQSKLLDCPIPSSRSSPTDHSCSSTFSNYSSRRNGRNYDQSIDVNVDSSGVSVSSISRLHKSFGRVPTYITDRKAKIEREEEEMRRLKENAPPAPGLVLMDESERLETLRMLEDNEKEAREALRSIPFKMNHQRAARLRQAIEFRLKEIEDTRKVFSKEKVFVAKDRD